jgi:cytoskeleton protein RodZ
MTISIGQQLRQAREARSVTLEDAARATHIRAYYLKAFEAGEFEILPSLVQGKGFLRAYASFLGIDPQPLIKELENEIGHSAAPTGPSVEAASAAQDNHPPASPARQPPATVSRPISSPLSRSQDSAEGRSQASAVSRPQDSAEGRSQASAVSRSTAPEVSRPVSSPRPDTRAAEAIFIEIGQKLRHQRELLGLSLEDVERHTHLRTHYLSTFEAGELQGLPSPVQGRGMLHNYATFLGLDPEPLLLRFAEGLQAMLSARQAVDKKPSLSRRSEHMAEQAAASALSSPNLASGGPSGTATSPVDSPASARATPRHLTLRRYFTPDVLIGALIVIFLAAFMVWGGLRILNLGSGSVSQTSTPTAPSIADVLSTNSAITPTPPAAELTQTVSNTLLGPVETLPLPTLAPSQAVTSTAQTGVPQAGGKTTAVSGPIQVNLVIRQRAWMRVLVDGKVEFDGIALPGSAYPYSGDKGIEVLTGNGAAIQVLFNQTDQGVLGGYGEVVDRIYTLKGVMTPTASITPTQPRTPTPLPGNGTPSAAPAAIPTATPTPRPTTRPSATATH